MSRRDEDLARLTRSFEQELMAARYAAIRGQKTSPITVTPQFVSQVATVSICCRILAGAISQLPIKMYEFAPGRDKEVRDHPIAEFLRAPSWCPWMTRVDQLSTMVWQIAQWGNTYNVITWDRSGVPVELEPLDPWNVTPKWSDQYYDRRGRRKLMFDVKGDGTDPSETYFASDLLIARCPSGMGIIGQAPAQQSPQSVQLAWHQENIAVEFCANSAKPSITVKVPGVITGNREKFLRDLKEQHRTGDPLVLEYGAEAGSLQIPFNQAQLLESRQFQSRQLAAMYGVFSHLLNDTDGAKYDNVEALDEQMGKYTFVPLCQRLELEMATKFLTPEERTRYYFRIKLDALLRGTMKNRHEAYKLSAGWRRVDEIRLLEDLDPLPNGEGEVLYQPQILPENSAKGQGPSGAVGSGHLDSEDSTDPMPSDPPTQRSEPSAIRHSPFAAQYEHLARATLTALATQERTQLERAARVEDRAEKISRLYEDLGRKLDERFPGNTGLLELFARRQDQLLSCTDAASIEACLSGPDFTVDAALSLALNPQPSTLNAS